MSASGASVVEGARSGRPRLTARLDRLSEGRFAAVAAAPGLILVAALIVPPFLAALGMSFFRIELGRDAYTPFVGLRNYVVRMPADAEFLGTLPLTLLFAVAVTALAVPVALGAASLIQGRRRLGGLLGFLLILPWAVAPIADGLFWSLMFDPSVGLVSQGLKAVGLRPIIASVQPGAFIALLVAVTWRAVPLLGVLLVGALRQVPRDLARAARLDGATPFQTFRHITLPAIAPTLIAAALLQVILTVQVFDIQFGMSGGSPRKGTELAGYEIFRVVIEQIALGYGAALTMVLAAFIGLCLWLMWVLVLRPRRRAPAEGEDLAGPRTALRIEGSRLPLAPEAHREPSTPSQAARLAVAGRSVAGRAIRILAIAAFVLWLAGPIVWILIASTQTEAALLATPPRIDLTRLFFFSYTALIGSREWQGAAVTSVVVSVGATALALLVATLTAYPLARYRLRGSRPLLLALLGSQLIPPIALAIPVLFIFIRLQLRDTILGLILINAAFWTPILVWLVRGAFLAVPRELEAAARIDGSSRLGVIGRIMLPVAAPAIAAAAAIVFVGIWNDFVFAATIGGRDTHTLPRYLGETFAPQYHVLASRIVLTVLPCVALVAVFRRRILSLA